MTYEELAEKLIRKLGFAKAAEMLDMMTAAKLNGYENAAAALFPEEFYVAFDKTFTRLDYEGLLDRV